MSHTVGRRMVDVAQKARGRVAIKYEFEVIPYFAGELPSGIDRLSFAWERGSKVFATEAEPVNPHTKAVFWKQYLKQTATLYQEGGARLLPKEYTFKLQHLKLDAKGHEERKTIGKIKIDLVQFCAGEEDPIPQEVFLQLKPVGKLKISIKASWLKHERVDLDAQTEASFSTRRSGQSGNQDGDHEQDLSGFEHEVHETPSPSHSVLAKEHGPGGKHHRSASTSSIRSKLDGASDARGSPRIKARMPLPNEIPGGFEPPMDPEEKRRLETEERTLAERRQKEEYAQMLADVTARVRAEFETAADSQSCFASMWQNLCCCGRRAKTDRKIYDQQETQMVEKEGARLLPYPQI